MSQGPLIGCSDANTYAVPLDRSWSLTNAVVTKAGQHRLSLVDRGLWPSRDGESFYSYNGAASFAENSLSGDWPADYSNTLEQYWPTSGEWNFDVAQNNTSLFWELRRARDSLYASGNGLHFALGGRQGDTTDWSLDYDMNIPGLVMFNESSQQWFNFSTKDFSSSGFVTDGAAHFATDYGPEALLLVFGGYVNGLKSSFDEMWMFEPVSRRWAAQQVSGEPPLGAIHPCVVGLAGDSGTYEVSIKKIRLSKEVAHTGTCRSFFMEAWAMQMTSTVRSR